MEGSPAPFTPTGSLRTASMRTGSYSSTASGVHEILSSAVQMSGAEPRALRKANSELQAQVDQLEADLDAARRRITELESTEARLHEYEQEMALHLDHADEQHRANETLTESLDTQNRRNLKLWKAHQESESACAALQGDLEHKVAELQLLRTQSQEVEEAHSGLQVQYTAAMVALRKFEEGPDQEVLSELVDELQATLTQREEDLAVANKDLALARKSVLSLTRELQEHKRQHDADMKGCDLAVEAATKALEASREAQKAAEDRLAPAEAAVAAGLERERLASQTLAAIEKEIAFSANGGADELKALKQENAQLKARLDAAPTGTCETQEDKTDSPMPSPEPEPVPEAKPITGNWKKLQMLSQKLPKSQSGMPLYQTKRVVAKVFEEKVQDDAKLGAVADRTPFASFFRDWVHQQYGLKETADQKILAIVKTVRTHGAAQLYHKANKRTAESKYDPRLWVFGQLTGITDSYAQNLVDNGADDRSQELAISLAARRELATYMIELLSMLYEGKHEAIDESMGDGKRGNDGWLPAAHVRRVLQKHFETCAPPKELPGASGVTTKRGWTSPYGMCTLHVRGLPKDGEGEDDLQEVFGPFGHCIQATVRHRSATVVDGVEVPAASWALVTYLEESSVDRLLEAQTKAPLLAGKAAKVPLSCQRVDIEKATTSTGAFGKTWRKGKGKAAAAIQQLVSLQQQGHLPATVGTGEAAARALGAWVEPSGPKPLTVMELSEDLDNMAKAAAAISKTEKAAASPSSKKGSGKKKMLQVDEVMALVIGSLLASQ